MIFEDVTPHNLDKSNSAGVCFSIMKPYRIHLFVCHGKNCSAKGSEGFLEALRNKLDEEGLRGEIKTSKSGCLGVCKETDPKGGFCPSIVIYPQGVWYRNVTQGDVADIVERHLKRGEVIEGILHFHLQV